MHEYIIKEGRVEDDEEEDETEEETLDEVEEEVEEDGPKSALEENLRHIPFAHTPRTEQEMKEKSLQFFQVVEMYPHRINI